VFDCMDYITTHAHEQLVFSYDRETGLRALIAIHDTRLGPALGGTRLWRYDHLDDAVLDVLRLAEGMTYKAAVAGLPLGGGKAVILADGQENDPAVRAARFRAFGRFVDGLGGRYITAEDVGTTPKDMLHILENTNYVVGLPRERGGSGDPSPVTAFGVMQGIRAAAEAVLGTRNLTGVHVAVQGLGKVGWALMEYLLEAGARITATDIRPDVLEQARSIGVRTVEPDKIYDVESDILAPCALGAIINERTIPRLKCRIIAGAANNQLEDVRRDSEALQTRGIVYVVDYVINAGGLINVAAELEGYDEAKAHARAAEIYYTVQRLLALARTEGVTTHQAAMMLARAALEDRQQVAV
jgi:leucine dehydrogenase